MLSINNLINIKYISQLKNSLLITLLFSLPMTILAGNEEPGFQNENIPIEFIENVSHLSSDNDLDKDLLTKLIRTKLLESYETPLRKVKVNVHGEDNTTIALEVYLLERESYTFETVLIQLSLDYQILSIKHHYEQEPQDLSSSKLGSCPDNSVDMVFATPENGIPTAVMGVRYACSVAEAAGYKCINLIGNEATIVAYQKYLSCDLKAFGNIGHGNPYLILLHDGTLSHTWFEGLSTTELNGMVIYFNSCEVHNEPFLSSIMNAGTRTYIGGVLPLWIGPSEEVFKCFWNEVLTEDTAMEAALFSCEAKHYPDPNAHGIAGDRGHFLEEKEYNCCSYESNGTTFCDASLGSYTFEECKALAKSAGAKTFKWGQVSDATAEVCWAGGTCGDVQEYLRVTLDNLTTSISENQLVIQWDTALEENNFGMNLWCAQMQGNQFQEITQLNSQLIPSKAILPNYGAPYSSIDYPYVNTSLKPGVQHCALEDMDASGQCTLHCDQIDTIVIGEGNNLSDMELNGLQAKAIALCNELKPDGICLEQLLAPNQ
jgi:hypothetical protein